MICKICGKNLPETEFYVHHRKPDGTVFRDKRCKRCVSDYNNYYHTLHYRPEKRREEYQANKEKYQEYYRTHREERIAYNAMYMRNKRAGGEITQEEWNGILKEFGNRCAYCGSDGKPFGLGMDHVIPLRSGGKHSVGNVVPACRSCNSRKHTNRYDEWYPSQPFFDPEKMVKILMHRMEEK